MLRTLLESFLGLAHWKQAIVVFSTLTLSPFLLLIGPIVALSLFPFLLFGRFEGDLGPAPFVHELKRAVERQK